MNVRRVAIRVCAIIIAAGVAPEAWAQRAAGPYAGLFGGPSGGGEVSEALDLRWSAYGGYDNVVPHDVASLTADPSFQQSGDYLGLSTNLSYKRQSDRNRFAVSGGTSLRRYATSLDLVLPTYTAGTQFAFAAGRATTVRGLFGGSSSPFYQFAPFLTGDPTAGDAVFGFASVARRSLSLTGGLGVTEALSPRSSLTVDAGWRRTRYAGGEGGGLESRNARLSFRQRFTSNMRAHFGYDYQDAQLSDARDLERPATLHDLDIGLDYDKALSFSRRTTVSFGTGTSVARSLGASLLVLTGRASLNQALGRTWNALLSYSRGSQLVLGFSQPLFSDSITADVRGQMGPRVELSMSGGYSLGQIGLQTTDDRFASYTGSTKLSVAVSRMFGVYAQYLYYHYGLPPTTISAPDLAQRFDRQAMTFGLIGWVPIINDARRRDSR